MRRDDINKAIRSDIKDYLAKRGPIDSRVMIGMMAKKYRTTRQRVCGDISFMVCREGSIFITGSKPHGVLN